MSIKGHRGVMMEGLIMPTKTRKRGSSPSSSSSSRIYSFRLNKRAILVGKNRAGMGVGLGRSRSSTPVPTWRTTPLRSAMDSPQGGQSTRAVTARRLAATWWEMNGMASPKMSEGNSEVLKRQQKKNRGKMGFKGEKEAGWGLHSGLGNLPPHLSDPPHSPTVSEKMDRSGMGSHRRRTPSIYQRLMPADQSVGGIDSISNASFMEIKTRSRQQTSSGSVAGSKSRLKDASSALTTSRELLKTISRIWARADQPSSSMSLISALHTELERARLQVNHLIQEQHSEKDDINYLIRCFTEEKASWKNKEQQAVEAAVGPILGELEVERKLRRRLESLNWKLGKELTEIKLSFLKAVKELGSEKRAREIAEQACEELARNIDEDRAEVEKLKRESVKVHEEVEKEREMLELADKLREERVQMKLLEAKHQFEEKNSAVSKLRKQLEVFLGKKRDKDESEGEDGEDSKEDSGESELHSIEFDLNGNNSIDKGYKWGLTSNEIKARNSVYGQVSRRSIPLQRSMSDGVNLTNQSSDEIEKEDPRSSYLNEMQRVKPIKGLKNQLLPNSRLGLVRENQSSSREKEPSWQSRDALLERSSLSKSRTADVSGESQTNRRSKW